MGMKGVGLEWANIHVPAAGRWELTLDQVLDCESCGSAYAIVTLQGAVGGAGGDFPLQLPPGGRVGG